VKLPWIERLRAWRTAELGGNDEVPEGLPGAERPGISRLYLSTLVGAAWLFWLPWAYATAAHRGDWNYYVAPFFVGMLLAIAVILSWAPASEKKYLTDRRYLAWLAVGLPVASMGLVGWEGGYEVGGVVLALIGVSPGVLVAWAFVLLRRHRRADWREHGQAEPD